MPVTVSNDDRGVIFAMVCFGLLMVGGWMMRCGWANSKAASQTGHIGSVMSVKGVAL